MQESHDLSFIEFKNQCVQGNKIFVKPFQHLLSTKKIESLIRIAKLQRYYQCNPVKFIEDFFHIELLDAQAWILTQAFITPKVLLLCTRGFGKSTLIDLMLMTKGMLFNNYWCYLCSGSSAQAQTTFTTLERLANDNIDTMVGSTGKLFKDEIVVKQASGDGFSHSSDGFSYELYNGSKTQTVNSNIDRQRGKRGNVVFDESSYLSSEMLQTYAAFAIVNKSFKSGKDSSGRSLDLLRIKAIPEEIPNQLFYISSASSTDTEYYKIYRDFSKRMLMGDTNYFVASIDCEIAFEPTIHGKRVNPLLTRETVEAALRTSPEKARREYLNQFTTDVGADAILKRGVITRNEETRKPLLYNDTGDKKFIIAYDPARSYDNSVISIMEVYTVKLVDGSDDIRGRIVSCQNLMDVGKKIKSPMRTPEQIEYLKQVILDYNAGADAYGNILGVYIDAGSGGGGVNIADFLMPDWEGANGIIHRGLIDKEYSEEDSRVFPNAVDKVRLISPTKYKSDMYECLIELCNQDKISFTAEYDNKGYLTIFDIDEELLAKERERIENDLRKKKLNQKEFEKKVNEELGNIQSVNTRVEKLTWKEELSLANIDAMKEEMLAMIRKKRDSGKDSFELAPERAARLHDDRSYTACLLAYGLAQERRKLILNKKPKQDPKSLAQQLIIRRGSYAGKII